MYSIFHNAHFYWFCLSYARSPFMNSSKHVSLYLSSFNVGDFIIHFNCSHTCMFLFLLYFVCLSFTSKFLSPITCHVSNDPYNILEWSSFIPFVCLWNIFQQYIAKVIYCFVLFSIIIHRCLFHLDVFFPFFSS